MDLWIRSQNRKMMERAVAVKIAHYKEDGKMSNSIVINNDYIFGEYATEERTLEVLDEITDLIKPKYVIRVDNHEDINNKFLKNKKNDYVSVSGFGSVINVNQTLYYEMPKE